MRDIDIDIDQYGTVDQQLHQIVSYRIFTIGLVGMFGLSMIFPRKNPPESRGSQQTSRSVLSSSALSWPRAMMCKTFLPSTRPGHDADGESSKRLERFSENGTWARGKKTI